MTTTQTAAVPRNEQDTAKISSTSVADAFRMRTVELIDSVCQKAGWFELAPPDDRLRQYLEKLAANAYSVLVVGEAKRGKSTFVNALMGCDLLPTDVEVATSQVFRIQSAPEWGYRLRFEDGSAQEIKPEEAARFGSQVVIDSQGMPKLSQIIRWIEVEGPFAFIPPGISILDTPGLGALYRSHAQITRRFVPQADAVIFVLDSNQPLGQPDLEFLEELLTITNNIFFIQTKIDLHRRDVWEAIRLRNEEILRERLGEKLSSIHVWPIASALLRKAAETGEEAYEMVSRHRELAVGLKAFLFAAAGWSRAADALSILDSYSSTGTAVLQIRLSALQEDSRQKREQICREAQNRKTKFEADWGEGVVNQRQMLEDLNKICTLGRTAFRQALQPSGSLENWGREEIAHATTLEEIKNLSETIGSRILNAAATEWSRTCQQIIQRCTDLLCPLQEAADGLAGWDGTPAQSLHLAKTHDVDVTIDKWSRLKAARNDAMIVAALPGTLVAFHVMTIGVFALTGPIGWAVLAGTAAAGIAGWHAGGQTQVEKLKGQLQQKLTGILQQVRSLYFDVSIDTGHFSITDEFYERLQQHIRDFIKNTVQRHAEEAQAEIDRLGRAAEATEEQRQEQAVMVQRQIAEWSELSRQIQQQGMGLVSLRSTVSS